MYDLIESSFLHIVDTIYNKWPRPVPALSRLEACKIISHRGQHDNLAVKENTLTAFDTAVDAGVWGLELDIRWTRDLKPMRSLGYRHLCDHLLDGLPLDEALAKLAAEDPASEIEIETELQHHRRNARQRADEEHHHDGTAAADEVDSSPVRETAGTVRPKMVESVGGRPGVEGCAYGMVAKARRTYRG